MMNNWWGWKLVYFVLVIIFLYLYMLEYYVGIVNRKYIGFWFILMGRFWVCLSFVRKFFLNVWNIILV